MSRTCRTAWCTNHSDVDHLGYPTHRGATVSVPVPDGAGICWANLVSAQLTHNEAFGDEPMVLIRVGENDGFYICDEAFDLADQFEELARQLRAMRATGCLEAATAEAASE